MSYSLHDLSIPSLSPLHTGFVSSPYLLQTYRLRENLELIRFRHSPVIVYPSFARTLLKQSSAAARSGRHFR